MFSHLPSYSHNVRLHQSGAQSNDDQGQHLQFIATHLMFCQSLENKNITSGEIMIKLRTVILGGQLSILNINH